MKDIDKVCSQLIDWLKEKVLEANGKGLVFGLSGGIDSSLVAALAKKAFPENSLGIIMPCYSNPEDEKDALLVAKTLNLKTKKVDLSDTYDVFLKSTEVSTYDQLAKANIKPRLRMTTLYYFAQLNNYLVAGGTNKSEFEVGYFTKHADSGSDILPIASFVKEEVQEMASFLGVPKKIIYKTPSAGLWEEQTDEEEMGFSYKVLDNYIRTGNASKNVKERIDKMNKNSEHKRKFPPVYNYKK